MDCAFTVVDQVLAPIIVAANIATLGVSTAPVAGAKTVVVGTKPVFASTKSGYYLLTAIKYLQTIDPSTLKKGASLLTRIKESRLGTTFSKITTVGKVGSELVSSTLSAYKAFAEAFVVMTSQEISNTLDSKLDPVEAAFIKRLWAEIQMKQMAEANGWAIADGVLGAVSIIDITGVTGLAAA